MKPPDIRLELLAKLGIEVMGVDFVAAFHAVVELRVDEADTVLPQKLYVVVVYRRDASRDRNIKWNGAAIVLRHVDRDGVAADGCICFEQPDVKPIRMLA